MKNKYYFFFNRNRLEKILNDANFKTAPIGLSREEKRQFLNGSYKINK